MTTTQKWTLGCLALAVIVLFGGGALAFLLLVPAVEEQIPPGVSTFIVTLSTPPNDAQVPLNQFTTVTAEALGVKPITALELWIDGTPSETKNAPAGSSLNQFAASWAWTPASEGEHTLVVRALDTNKGVGMSNVVLVTASKDANVVPSAGYQTTPGDTVASVAQTAKVTPQQIVDLNPQISPSGTITPGQVITIPIPPPPTTETPTPEPPPSPVPPSDPGDPGQGPPSKQGIWIGSLWGQLFGVDSPETPGLTTSAGMGKCSIDLYIDDKSNNESGFYIYRLDNKTPTFKHIATLDAHSGPKTIHYIDPVSTGKYQYYVAAFNSAGVSASKIVKAAIIEPCGAPPGLGFSKGTVTVKQSVDKIYCYLSVDNGPWTRIPSGINTFITPTKPGEFDVSKYLKSLTPAPPPDKITLHLECWGWKGNTLIYLGEATETVNQGATQIIGKDFIFAGYLASQLQLFGTISDPHIARPTNVKTTLDPNECASHFPSGPWVKLKCATAASSGYQFLTWDWSPAGCAPGNCVKDIDGYHVYMYYLGNQPTLIDTVNGSSTKAAIIPPKPAPMFPPFFFVRAFKGSAESADSNEAQSKTILVKETLPLTSGGWKFESDKQPGILCITYPYAPPTLSSGQILVGYFHHYDPGLGCKKVDYYYRGAVWFDLSKIKGGIVDAHLQYRQASGKYSIGSQTWLPISCASKLLRGKENWMNNPPAALLGDDYLNLPGQILPTTFDIDVTGAVKQWVWGSKPNNGFIFRGVDETFPETNNECTSVYTDFALKVTYQPK